MDFISRTSIVVSALPDVWKLEDLMQAVGNVDRSSAVKALSTWANMGVVKEQEDGTFILLEHAEEDTGMMVDGGLGGGGDSGAGGGGGGSLPPPPSAAQQQAAQMQVHWNVSLCPFSRRCWDPSRKCSRASNSSSFGVC